MSTRFSCPRRGEPMNTSWVWLAVQLMAMGLTLMACLSGCAPTGTLTNLNDNARSGAYEENTLVPATVNAGTTAAFGKLHTWLVEGQIYAQPLYVRDLIWADGILRNVVFVATQKNRVYAFDATSFAMLWNVTLVPAVPSVEMGC